MPSRLDFVPISKHFEPVVPIAAVIAQEFRKIAAAD